MYTPLVSVGDFVDLYYEVRRRGFFRVLKQVSSSPSQKVINTWACIDPGSTGWWIIPAVRRRWNNMISGDAEISYQHYLAQKYWPDKFSLRLLSVGCGGGTPELEFLKTGCFVQIEAFDISPAIIAHAQEKADRLHLPGIHFFTADAARYVYGKERWDAVLFHSSFHHLRRPEKILPQVAQSLCPGGLLIVNEYVGPDRNQWRSEQLQEINRLLAELPPRYRKRYDGRSVKQKAWRPGRLRMLLNDPSEAVHSSTLPDLIRANFETVEEKSYGGNLLHPLLKDIAHNFVADDSETTAILEHLFRAEDNFLRRENVAPDFLFGIYRKK